MQALELLQKHFGYSSFNPAQEEIINDVLAGRDVFVLMPTGSGKSLCYQLPALMKPGITVVVSPLIALMKDQVDALRINGIGASCINSSMAPVEAENVKVRLLTGKDKLLYIAPERFASYDFLPFLKMLKIALFAIDEAHCISEWGHDFRPEYRRLRLLRDNFPEVPIIALTATAIPEVQEDIVKSLMLKSPAIHRRSFNRENLTYYVRPKKDSMTQIVDYIRARPKDSGIIYCQGRKTADRITARLQQEGFRAFSYHAGLSADKRETNQDAFIKDDAEIVVATIAFGMGINKTNVRYVIHYDLPRNIEGYYQETGRAGRDRLESDCILFYTYADKRKVEYFIELLKSPKKQATARKKLAEMLDYCESKECRRRFLLNYFGESFDGTCTKCDNCIAPQEMINGTDIAKKALRCVLDLEQRFGATYISSLLTGKSKSYAHSMLKSCGAGKEYTAKQWTSFIRELQQQGFLRVEGDKYPVLKITQSGMDALRGSAAVQLTKPVKVRITKKEEPITELFDILRQLRKVMADAERVPPYIIFPDSTLREMSTYYPQTIEAVAKIHGVGEHKLQKYGRAFLRKILDYCKEHGVAEKEKNDEVPRLSAGPQAQTLFLAKQGLSLREIATRRGLAESTIASHIESLFMLGNDVNIDNIVPKERQAAIEGALSGLGAQALAPLKEKLGDAYSYDELRIVRAMINSRRLAKT